MGETSTQPSTGLSQSSTERPKSRPAELTFEQLMEAVRAGSEEAAWRIAELYSPHLLRAVRASLPRAIRPKVDSIDIVNTLWGSLLTKPGRLTGIHEPGQLVALLTAAARNRVIDEHRKYSPNTGRDVARETAFVEETRIERSARVASDPPNRSGQPTPSQAVAVREKWRVILDALPQRDREIVALRIRGKTYQEIAAAIPGVSDRTARRVISDAVTQLNS